MWSQICHFIGRLKTGSMHLRQLRVCAHIVGDHRQGHQPQGSHNQGHRHHTNSSLCFIFTVFLPGLLFWSSKFPGSTKSQECLGMTVWQGATMDSFKFQPGPPCPTLLRNRKHLKKKTLLFMKKRWDFEKKRGCKKTIKKPNSFVYEDNLALFGLIWNLTFFWVILC